MGRWVALCSVSAWERSALVAVKRARPHVSAEPKNTLQKAEKPWFGRGYNAVVEIGGKT